MAFFNKKNNLTQKHDSYQENISHLPNLKELKEEIQQLKLEKENLLKEKEKILKEYQKNQEEIKKHQKEHQLLEEKYQWANKVLNDKGYQALRGFKQLGPFLNQVLGRDFILTIAEEFQYAQAEDLEELNSWLEEGKKIDKEQFFCFRDQIRKGYSFRVTSSFSSKNYQLQTAVGIRTFTQLMFPQGLLSGLEINSNNKSAMYLALKEKKKQAAVLPEQVFGAPLLSYALPIFDDEGMLIGAVSFSNDITQIVKMGKSLGNIVDSDSDATLNKLASVLKEELDFTDTASVHLKDESIFTQQTADEIKKKGKEVIEIAERLKVLSLNTAIEATRVGKNGQGVGVISEQMKMISENTRKILKDIYKQSLDLSNSSKKTFNISSDLEKSATKMKEESAVLFKTSVKITNQKDELASLVRHSIDEIAQDQEDLNAIFMLIQKT